MDGGGCHKDKGGGKEEDGESEDLTRSFFFKLSNRYISEWPRPWWTHLELPLRLIGRRKKPRVAMRRAPTVCALLVVASFMLACGTVKGGCAAQKWEFNNGRIPPKKKIHSPLLAENAAQYFDFFCDGPEMGTGIPLSPENETFAIHIIATTILPFTYRSRKEKKKQGIEIVPVFFFSFLEMSFHNRVFSSSLALLVDSDGNGRARHILYCVRNR